MTAPLVALAPAKVNLTLRVLGRRGDGLHELESLVVFSTVADRLSLKAGQPLGLDLKGPMGRVCGPTASNLVLKAARSLAAHIPDPRLGLFVLDKRIPVAAGLGGGSADAAAALRLLAKANRVSLDDPRLHAAALATGADVAVCLDPRPRIMSGIGDVLSEPLALPSIAAVLVNPGLELPTKEVFAAFDRSQTKAKSRSPLAVGPVTDIPRQRTDVVSYLAGQSNDLEAAAVSLQPVVGNVLAALRATPRCRLARMSGSGATCFGLYDSAAAAAAAARSLRATHPKWWIRTTSLGGG